MKRKGMWVVVVALCAALLVTACAAPAPTPAPTPEPTPALEPTPAPSPGEPCPLPPRVDPAPKALWDTKGYWPISMEGKRIDVIYLMEPHPVSMNWKQGMLDRNEDGGYGFEFGHFDTNFSAEVLNEATDASIARGVDLVIISPPDPASGVVPIEKIQAANIPCLMFLNQSDKLPDVSVMVDSYAQGRQCGELLAEALDFTGKVGVFMGDFVTATCQGRRGGFTDVIAQYPDMEVVADTDTPTGPWARQGAYDAMKGILAANPDIDGVFAGDDNMAIGAIVAIEEVGKADDIVVVGLGGEKAGLEAIKEGRMYGTSWYSPYKMGRALVEASVYILSSPGYRAGTLQGINWTEIIKVTIDNVDDVLWPPAG